MSHARSMSRWPAFGTMGLTRRRSPSWKWSFCRSVCGGLSGSPCRVRRASLVESGCEWPGVCRRFLCGLSGLVPTDTPALRTLETSGTGGTGREGEGRQRAAPGFVLPRRQVGWCWSPVNPGSDEGGGLGNPTGVTGVTGAVPPSCRWRAEHWYRQPRPGLAAQGKRLTEFKFKKKKKILRFFCKTFVQRWRVEKESCAQLGKFALGGGAAGSGQQELSSVGRQ